MTTRAYDAYIKSPLWRARSARWKAMAGGRCRRCGRTRHLHSHHLTYARLGQERDSDILVLCARCHRRAHGRWSVARILLGAILIALALMLLMGTLVLL